MLSRSPSGQSCLRTPFSGPISYSGCAPPCLPSSGQIPASQAGLGLSTLMQALGPSRPYPTGLSLGIEAPQSHQLPGTTLNLGTSLQWPLALWGSPGSLGTDAGHVPPGDQEFLPWPLPAMTLTSSRVWHWVDPLAQCPAHAWPTLHRGLMPWESDSGLEVCVSHASSLGPQRGMHTHSAPKGETGVSWQEASLPAKRACRTCPGYHPQGPPRDGAGRAPPCSALRCTQTSYQ